MNISKSQPDTLFELLNRDIDNKKKKIALNYDEIKITYGELLDKVDSLASVLDKQKLRGKNVAIIMDNSLEFITILFSLSKINAQIFLVNPNFDIEIIKKLLEITKTEVILTDRKNMSIEFSLEEIFILPNTVQVINLTREYSNIQKFGELLQTSSGTTGIPKITIRNSINIKKDMENILSTYRYKLYKNIYAAVPFYHGYGLTMGLLAPITAGITVVFSKIFLPNRFCLFISENNLDIFIGAPNTFKLLNGMNDDIVKYIHNIPMLISSGSPITSEIAMNFYHKYKKWIIETYGMMEASSMTANLLPNEKNYFSVGKAVNGVEIKLINDMVYIKSEAVSDYYVTENGIQKIELSNGWFYTKDTGFSLDTGELMINERK